MSTEQSSGITTQRDAVWLASLFAGGKLIPLVTESAQGEGRVTWKYDAVNLGSVDLHPSPGQARHGTADANNVIFRKLLARRPLTAGILSVAPWNGNLFEAIAEIATGRLPRYKVNRVLSVKIYSDSAPLHRRERVPRRDTPSLFEQVLQIRRQFTARFVEPLPQL